MLQGQFKHSPTGLFGDSFGIHSLVYLGRRCPPSPGTNHAGTAVPLLLSLEIRVEGGEQDTLQLGTSSHCQPEAAATTLPTLLPSWQWVCPSQSGWLFYFYGNISPEKLQSEPSAV